MTVNLKNTGKSYFGFYIPYLDLLGVEPILCENDRAVTRLNIRDDLLNSRGHVHGGAIMSVLDFTLSAAGRSLNPLGLGLATIDMTTSCMEPGITDLIFEARCLRRGGSIAFCEGEARDPDGKLIAKASATFKIFKLSPGSD
jgi:uncharacterized protein (TIGR00369 family)